MLVRMVVMKLLYGRTGSERFWNLFKKLLDVIEKSLYLGLEQAKSNERLTGISYAVKTV